MRTTLLLGLLASIGALGGCSAAPQDDGATSTDTALAAGACSTKLTIASVSASGAQAGNPAGHATDGDLATRWSNEGAGSAITADLGATKDVCGVNVAWYQGTQRTTRFTVAVSTDGAAFSQVYDGASSGKSDALELASFATAKARYVRLTVNGNSVNDWASVDELTVGGAASSAFVHPGVLVSQSQLDLVKAKIAAGAEPWKSAYDQLLASTQARSTYVASPRADIDCGSHYVPDNGCSQEMGDAHAAYANALIWAYTGKTANADKAIQILDAYATTVTSHTNSAAPLQAAWAAESFTRAAEIVRHTSTRWPSANAARFGTFLRTVYLPLVQNGRTTTNGNWELSMIDATIDIAVFTDDHALFDSAIAMWKKRVPAYIYLTSDGPLPVRPANTTEFDPDNVLLSFWMWPTTSDPKKPAFPFVNGVAQETCRDFEHTSMGVTSMTETAETAHIQGVDLYSYSNFASRITQALEFHSNYLNGATIPSSLCGGEAAYRPNVGFLSGSPAASALNFEVAYNHYANRLGMSLPQTKLAIQTISHNGSTWRGTVGQTAAWENLTNAEK